MATLLADGDQFALLAIETRSEIMLAPTEMLPGLWISSSPPIEMDEFWRDTLGSHQSDQFEACTLFALVRGVRSDPDFRVSGARDLWQIWTGLLLAERFGTDQDPFLIVGNVRGASVEILTVHRLDPARHEAADRYHRLKNQDVERAAEIARAIRAYPWIGSPRLNRVLSLYVDARGRLDWMDRIHQYTRCLDGLTIPPMKGGAGRNFGQRMELLAATSNGPIFRELYDIRGAIEHLRENDYTEPFDRGRRLDLIRKAGIAEFATRASLARILESQTLWKTFKTKTDLEGFWSLSAADQQQLWGSPIDPTAGIAGFDDNQWADWELGSGRIPPHTGP